MKTWIVAGIGIMALLGAGFALQRAGIDLVALSGLGSDKTVIAKTESRKDSAQPRGNRGAIPVEVARAARQAVSDDISAIGNLVSSESVSIAPETSGRIAAIHFEDGDAVAQGAPLFDLNPELAQAALSDAKARLILAEANFKRSDTLQRSGTTARSSHDAAVAELQAAQAAVESAEILIRKLSITAPFSGVLGFRIVSPGAYVSAGADLVRLDKIDLLKVSFSVPELHQSRIAIGQEIEVTADAVPGEKFSAKITALDPVVDVNGRALRVRADLDNAALKLRPGFLVRVTVSGNQRQAVTVPESAIIQRGEESFVYVVGGKVATEAKVETGKRMPGTIEIISGVTEGAEVVVAGSTRLSDGAAVEIVSAQAPVN